MIVSSTGTSAICLGAFLGAFFALVFGGRFFSAVDFRAPLPGWRTLDLTFFGVARFTLRLFSSVHGRCVVGRSEPFSVPTEPDPANLGGL